MNNQTSIFQGLIYPSFQEPATATSHMNMAKIAKGRGVETLHKICRNIAKDETRHAAFYSEVVTELMRIAPERTLMAYNELMNDTIIMPALNMTDETYTEPPTLFKHFSRVANKIGVYTSRDYADIIDKLNKTFRVADSSVKDVAAEAQDYLCKLPDRIRDHAEKTRDRIRIAKPVGFDWIYGRTA